MKRRDFLKSTAAFAGATMVSAPAVFSPAKAQSRQETLLIVSESGPNNIDIHGVGTNVPGYEVSWNCYDRLISHEMKAGPNGTPTLTHSAGIFTATINGQANIFGLNFSFGDVNGRIPSITSMRASAATRTSLIAPRTSRLGPGSSGT